MRAPFKIREKERTPYQIIESLLYDLGATNYSAIAIHGHKEIVRFEYFNLNGHLILVEVHHGGTFNLYRVTDNKNINDDIKFIKSLSK